MLLPGVSPQDSGGTQGRCASSSLITTCVSASCACLPVPSRNYSTEHCTPTAAKIRGGEGERRGIVRYQSLGVVSCRRICRTPSQEALVKPRQAVLVEASLR